MNDDEKEWKKFQNFVKETDKKNTNDGLGVSLYIASRIITLDDNNKIIKNVKID